jgi:Spy/CpxP family protein refolding chaperone
MYAKGMQATMIRKSIMILSLAAATTFAMAQAPEVNKMAKPHGGHGQHQQLTQDQFVNKRLTKMTDALQLSSDQQAKMKDILSDEWTKQQAIRSNTSLSKEDAHKQIRELRKSEHEKMKSVLTPEQVQKAQQMHKERGEKGGGRGMAGKRMGFMARELNLTDAQKAQLKPMFQQQREQMQALKADTSLTPEQKHEKAQQIRADGRKQFLSVLTPEQQQKLRDMRAKRGERKGETPAQPGPGF